MRFLNSCVPSGRIIRLAFVFLLSTSGGFCANAFKFSESIRTRLVCEGSGAGRDCDIGVAEHFFHIHAKFLWVDPSVVTNIDAATAFNFSFGYLAISFSPGLDPTWAPGKRVVTMLFTNMDEDLIPIYSQVVLKWSDAGFKVNIHRQPRTISGTAWAASYFGGDAGRISDTLPFHVGFSDFQADGSVKITGRLKRRNIDVANGGFTLDSVTLHGTLTPSL